MKKEDAIKYLKQLYPNGGHCWLDEQRIEAIGMAIKALQEEPVSEKKCIFTKDHYTDEDRQVLCDGCEEECEFSKKEESVKIKKGCKYRCLSDMVNKDTGNISFIGDKIYLAPKDNTLVSEENGWLCDTSENASNFELVEEPVSEDEIEKQFKAGDVVVYVSRQPAYSGLYLLGNPNDLSIGYSNANEPYQIALRNCTVASEDERKQFMRELESNGYEWNDDTLMIEKVEPVSEDLEKAIDTYLKSYWAGEKEKQEWPFLKKMAIHFAELQKQKDSILVSEELEEASLEYFKQALKDGDKTKLDAFKAGAKWQKAKDEFTTEDLGEYINELSKQFPEVSFAKLSRIAVRVAKWQQERDEADRAAVYKCGWNDRKAVMMAKAIDGKVIANGMGNPILHLWDKGKHLIDKKVKVILIKEDYE